ncbi:MAG: poly-gamma-glutamate hydrolase family protein [Thermodesulfobacteriota bacterium]
MGKTYESYLELRSVEREGLDYRVRSWKGSSGIAVMAPHGGDIEPGTTEIAEATARPRHAFYSFEGLKPDQNLDLHIASTLFDEPEGLRIALEAMTVITIHGCRERDPVVFAGGLDVELRRIVAGGLETAGFMVREDPRLPGRSLMNLCNRSRMGRGVQLEVSQGLRRTMFPGLRGAERMEPLPAFDRFVAALRKALGAYGGTGTFM